MRGEDVVVEWYDFGKGALYEFAKLLILDPAAQANLIRELALPAGAPASRVAATVARRFQSLWDVEEFATKHGIAIRVERDFAP